MEARYSVERTQAFVAREDSLKKLADLLSDRIGELSIQAKCADDVTRTFKTVKELAAYENARAKQIKSLDLSATSDDLKKRASISLSRRVTVDFTADDEVVSRLRTQVLDVLDGMRPWYSGLHRIDFVQLMFFGFAVLWIGVTLAVAFNFVRVGEKRPETSQNSAMGELILASIVATIIGLGLFLTRFRNSAFPKAVFLVGQGKIPFEHLERIQWGIVIAFVVSLIAGFVILGWQSFTG